MTRSAKPLPRVKVSSSGKSIWDTAMAFIRHTDVNNMVSLRNFTARNLEPTLGGYTYPATGSGTASNIVINTSIGGLSEVYQTGIVFHEGRHVHQILGGAIRPSVRNERDALAYERAFLSRHRGISDVGRRIQEIGRQLRQLRKQNDHDYPQIEVDKDRADEFVCGMIRRPNVLAVEVSMRLKNSDKWERLGSLTSRDGTADWHPESPEALPILKALSSAEMMGSGAKSLQGPLSVAEAMIKHYEDHEYVRVVEVVSAW